MECKLKIVCSGFHYYLEVKCVTEPNSAAGKITSTADDEWTKRIDHSSECIYSIYVYRVDHKVGQFFFF
jgi:hypothetical protein